MAFPRLRTVLYETFLFSFCVFVVQLSRGTECSSDECKVERISAPEFVTAFYEHRPALSGCISRERSPTGQEIHVVLVRGSMSSNSPGVGNNVDVMIKRTSHFSGREKAIFVLASTQPTIWRIHSEHSSNESLGLFVVSKNSTVLHDRRTKLKTRKQELPLESQKLMTWARKKWKAVTSLMKTELASVVDIHLGNDPSATEKCEILSHLPNIYVSHIEAQEIRGCVSKWNEDHDGMDVHVIELLSPTVESVKDDHVDVTVDIRSKSRPVKSRHVVLVLKSHVGVHWHVTTRNLRGTLDIITDQVVESNGTNTQSFRVAVETLTAYSGQELISWTCDKYGAPISYTEAYIANRLNLVVDGRGNLLSSHSDPTTEMTPRENHGLDGRQPSSHGYHHHDYSGNSLGDELMSLRFGIIRSLQMECSEDHVLLVIQKAALMYRNLPVHSVSFRDASCKAESNRSHYILYAKTHSCGMSNRTTDDSVAFLNAIVIEWESQQGNVSAGSSSDSSKVSDPVRLTINISCDYPIAATSKEMPSSSSLDIQFRLRLFRDATYRDEILTFPAGVETWQNIFVQANITADICIQINVQSCSLDADDAAVDFRSRSLIVNGCIVDKSVQWLRLDGEGSRQSQHFQVNLEGFGDGNYKVNFHCQLAVCDGCQSSVIPTIPPCKSRENYCSDRNTAIRDKRLVVSVSRGPLMLIPRSLPTNHANHTSSGQRGNANTHDDHQEEPQQKHSCEVVQVEGLSMEIVISIAFAAFIIGILLMASLWYIYVRTGPGSMNEKSGMQSASNSGDSTPSSTAPITVHQVATSHR